MDEILTQDTSQCSDGKHRQRYPRGSPCEWLFSSDRVLPPAQSLAYGLRIVRFLAARNPDRRACIATDVCYSVMAGRCRCNQVRVYEGNFAVNVDTSMLCNRALYVMLVGLVSLHLSAAAAWQEALSPGEISKAIELAEITTSADLQLPTSVAGADRTTLQQTSIHALGTQVIFVELVEQKKAQSDRRLAEIFTYDYDSQSAQRRIVDVQLGALVSIQDIDSAHLPLSDIEIDYANWLLWNNTGLRQHVLQELGDLQLTPSADLLALTDARVSVWVPGSHEQGASSGCHLQRCALFSLYSINRDSLTIDPVVNLVSGEVFTDLPL